MMSANTATVARPNLTACPATHDAGPLFGDLYRFHGFRVFDVNGERVGIVDWIWGNETNGEGEYIGLQLQWLRGRARAVPASAGIVDRERAIVRLPYSKQQIARAPRFQIDRALSSDQRVAIAAHFMPSTVEAGSNSLPAPVAA
jgi:hypothetical protein